MGEISPSRTNLQVLLGDAPAQSGDAGGVFFGDGVADLAIVIDTDLHQIRRIRKISYLLECKPQIPGHIGFAAAVTNLMVNRQGMLEELDSLTGFTELLIGDSQVAEGVALVAPVTQRARTGQPLLV